MTRKDYILIAAALKQAYDHMPDSCVHNMYVDYIADALAQDNPRFDRARFLAACGVQE